MMAPPLPRPAVLALIPVLALALAAPPAARAPAAQAAGTLQTAGTTRAAADFEPLPAMPVNACNDASLPRSYGTNYPTPTDPYGFGWRNQSAVGWPENRYPAFAYISGS